MLLYKIVKKYLVLILACLVLVSCGVRKDAYQPTTKRTYWGSSGASFPGEEKVGQLESWVRLNEKIKSLNGGYGLDARRSYDKMIPLSWAASAMSKDSGLCPVSFGSFKADWKETAEGTNFQKIKTFVESIPDNRIVYLAFHHEPEDNVKQKDHTVEMLQKAFAGFVDAVLAANKPNVHPTFILMSYTFRPVSKRNPDDYNMVKYVKPNQLKKVVAGLDGYTKTPGKDAAKNIFDAAFTTMSKWGVSRFGIFEIGAQTTIPGERVKWINELAQWVKARGDVEAVSWFNSGNGPHAGPIGWFLGQWSVKDGVYSWDDSDGSVAAYAQLLKL